MIYDGPGKLVEEYGGGTEGQQNDEQAWKPWTLFSDLKLMFIYQ